MYIKEVIPSLIKDSKGDKTFQIEIKTYNGKYISSAPSGTSKGKHEVANYNQKGIEHSLLMMRAFSRTLEGKNFIIKKIEDLKKNSDNQSNYHVNISMTFTFVIFFKNDHKN